jgi:hypothetical protein
MDDIIHWDNANWSIEENVFLPELGEWHTKWPQHSNLTPYQNL